MSAYAGTARQNLPTVLLLALLSLVILALVVAPLFAILYRAFVDVQDGTLHLTDRHIVEVLTTDIYWHAFGNTLLVSCGAAVIATVLGTFFAWVFVRTNTVGRAVLEQISQLPIFIPPFVGAVAWVLLAAPRVGILNRMLMELSIPGGLDVYTHGGMLSVIGLYLAPYVMMIVAGSLRSMDPSLEEAAQVAGLTKMQTALRITGPVLAPAILSGAVLAFTIAIGLFGTPVVLGWSRQILLLTSRIWISAQEVPPDYGVMAVLSIYLLLLSSIAALIQRALLKDRNYVTITGKGFRPRLVELGGWGWLSLAIAIFYVFFTIVAPIAVLIAAALSQYTWSADFSFDNFVQAISSDDVWFTMQNSVIISIVSATIATVLGICISWIAIRTRLPGRHVLEHLILLPISIPGIAFGVGVMLVWIGAPVTVYGTAIIIVFAFVGRFTAYAVRSISSSLVQVHPELEESARIIGYGPLLTFARITLPLILPSILAGWLLLFSFFMTELSMVVILYTAASRTFSVLSFEVWNVGDFSKLASYSLLQMAIGVLFMTLLKLFFGSKTS
ncbi:iron(III) transport system permease protein [Rhodoligotrophos appendicifer]|uniref:ABC transporter permease n=1 Tax=Rhodoligotrophos appendicifer TaxID=987056 RepID=UPI0011870702|nr:iron ABC transporter permease [Rhodoligotrophos appendicifer]